MPHRILTGEEEAQLERAAARIRALLWTGVILLLIALGLSLGGLVYLAAKVGL